MELSRRSFLKAGGAGALASTLAFELTNQSKALAQDVDPADWKLVGTKESTNICCYCAGGCGSLLSSRNGELINLEGDPDHPINQGGLCPKIARKVKDTRDEGFVEKEMVDGEELVVNRCQSIASLGGSQENSEEEYLILKMMRQLGVVAIDNQARV